MATARGIGHPEKFMAIGIAQAAINLGGAVTLGAIIGFERQWRQHLAGLRTNTLVALGAASFVVFDNLLSTEAWVPTRSTCVVSVVPTLRTPIASRFLGRCLPVAARTVYWSKLWGG